MPNWCECELDITGESSILKELLDKATTNEMLDADKIIPYPTEFAEMDRIAEEWDKAQGEEKYNNSHNRPVDGFNSGGREWRDKNWGTKWGFCHQDDNRQLKNIDKEKGNLQFNFDCAWSPPTPLIKKLSEMFPTLRFNMQYWEGGAGFQGVAQYMNGEEIKNVTMDYSGRRGG
jgi:hypothetical protein